MRICLYAIGNKLLQTRRRAFCANAYVFPVVASVTKIVWLHGKYVCVRRLFVLIKVG